MIATAERPATYLPAFGVLRSGHTVDCDICGGRHPATLHVFKDSDTWYLAVYCDHCGYERERRKISRQKAVEFFAEMKAVSALVRAAR